MGKAVAPTAPLKGGLARPQAVTGGCNPFHATPRKTKDLIRLRRYYH